MMRKILLAVVSLLVCSLLTNPAIAADTLVAQLSDWKYLDTGTDLGDSDNAGNPGNWADPGFDDSGWLSGPGKLGYNDSPDTAIRCRVGEDPCVTSGGGKIITYYFRHSFNVANPSRYSSLTLGLLRDDGAIVYLNGTELQRDNMPGGNVSSTTLAASSVSGADESTYFPFSGLNSGLLVAGANVLAVEVHQRAADSSDLGFDLELLGETGLTRGPYLQSQSPTSIVVRWRTDVATDSRVEWGTAPGSLTNTVDDATSTTEHEVTLTGLTPGATIYYSIGSTTETLAGGTSDYFFVQPPALGTDQSMRIWLLGDSGTANSDAAAVRDAYAAYTGGTHTDLWVMLGDNAYDNGTDAEHQAAIFDMYPEMLRTSALWPTRGNHETDAGVYYGAFTLPTVAASNGFSTGVDSGSEAYYSYDFGNVHFVVLDSQAESRAIGGAMLTWLESDLIATSLNAGSDWVIAYWHHPPYTKGTHDSDSPTDSGGRMIDMRENALPILERYGVDMVLAGHSHNYERSYFLDGHYGLSTAYVAATHAKDSGDGRVGGDGAYTKSAAAQQANAGAVYVVNGQSGNRGGGTNGLDHPVHFYDTTTMGSVVLDISGDTLDALYLDNNGNQLDTFRITKNPTALSCSSVTLDATADTYIDGNSTSTNYGSATPLLVDGSNPEASALLKWDLSPIPSGSTIESASIYLNVTNASDDVYDLYQVQQAWVEGEATWTQYATGSNWQTAGASGALDRGTASLGTTPGSNETGIIEKIAVNSTGLQLISDWLEGVADNHGLIVQNYSATNGYQFDSREGGIPPRLTVEYCQVLDYGDLPDTGTGTGAGNYETLAASDGPWHTIAASNNPRLGPLGPDTDDGSLQNAAATADDGDNVDDEDGITVTTLTQGQAVDIPYIASDPDGNARLNAWVDWNNDGDFGDPGEQVATNVDPSDGANNLSVTVPADATPGVSVGARFRFSAQQGLAPTGGASDGEVEDYLMPIAAAAAGTLADWGDLPSATYPTLSGQNGPNHTIAASNPRLGAAADADNDGQPDDNQDLGGNDEDGVTFPVLVTGETANITYTVSGPAGAVLNAWIDWNGDGDFDDTVDGISEQIAADESTVTGSLAVTVPLGAVTGTDLGARFRLSTDTGLAPTGNASDGEVEDYLVRAHDEGFAIGDFVWIDVDEDGIQDSGEPGLSGVTVELRRNGGALVASDLTDTAGAYLFANVAAGDYYVEFVLPGGFVFTAPNQGGDAAVDSDADPTTGRTASFSFAGTVDDLDLDAGLVAVRAGCTTVEFQQGTNGYAGAADTYIWQENTAINYGAEEFLLADADDPPGSTNDVSSLLYWDVSSIPPGATVQSVGITVEVTNVTDATGFDLYAMEQAWTELGATWDTYDGTTAWPGGAGGAGAGSRGTTVLGNVNPTSTGPHNIVLNASGVAVLQSWVDSGAANKGLMLWAGTTTDGLDFASRDNATVLDRPRLVVEYCAGAADIGDKVWSDLDSDGIQDVDEPGVPNVPVRLWNAGADGAIGGGDDTLVSAMPTHSDGSYGFTGLVAGDYYVQFLAPDGVFFTKPHRGADSALDSDADAGGYTGAFAFDGTTPNPTVDGGMIDGSVCFAEADSSDTDQNSAFEDVLVRVDLLSGVGFYVGQAQSGVTDIEAIEWDPISDTLYAADGNDFGTLDSDTGLFTSIRTLTQCELPAGGGTATLNDFDGLAFDPRTGVMYVAERNSSALDLLLAIDPTTGNLIPDAFGSGVTCVEVEAPAGDTSLISIDDLGISSAGVLYGVANKDATVSRMVSIDYSAGATAGDTVDLGLIVFKASPGDPAGMPADGTPVTDVEGMSIDETGRILISTGQSGIAEFDDSIFALDMSSGVPLATYSTTLGGAGTLVDAPNATTSYEDYEGLTCYMVSSRGEGLHPGAIGNNVWLDENADGYQDAGEAGIANVAVELYTPGDDGVFGTADDVLFDTTVTDVHGGYLFPGLLPGLYQVLLPASNFGANAALEGMNQTESPVNGGGDFGNQDLPQRVILVNGVENLTADFGFNPNPAGDVDNGTGTAALGDRVWVDSDGDGAQDPNESGVGGVTVTLYNDHDGDGVYDNALATTTTDATGNYLFDGLAPDGYVVVVTDDSGASHAVLGANYTQTGDPDHFGAVGLNNDNRTTTPVLLAPGDLFVNADFGYRPESGVTGTIGDTVWLDADADGSGPALPPANDPGGTPVNQGNGAQNDSVEYGIPGVTVALIRDSNGDGIRDSGEPVVATAITDASGQYLFEGLQIDDGIGTDDYLVWVNDTAGVLSGHDGTYDADGDAGAGGDTQADSVFGLSSVQNLTATAVLGQDFGYTVEGQTPALGAIGDTVWFDMDGSGGNQTTQGSEPGIEGVVMELYRLDPVSDVYADYFDGGADYSNSTQPPGTVDWSPTPWVEANDDNNASSGNIFVSGDRLVLEGDVGSAATKRYIERNLGDLSGAGSAVWTFDWDHGGTWEVGEDFVTFEVNSGSGWVVLKTLDGGDVEGTGSARESFDISAYLGSNVSIRYSIEAESGSSAEIFYVDNVQVEVVTSSTFDRLIATRSTNDNGNYLFGGLDLDESYRVKVADSNFASGGVLEGLGATYAAGTGLPSNEGNLIPLSAATPINLDQDFSYLAASNPGTIGNQLWLDTDADGLYEPGNGESGVAGVTVDLYRDLDGDGLIDPDEPRVAATTTGSSGTYLFTGLPTADMLNGSGGSDYVVDVSDRGGLLAGYWHSLGTAGNDNNSQLDPYAVSITSASPNDLTADFGYYVEPAALGNYVWEDTNRNGIQDTGEPPIAGVAVTLNVTYPDASVVTLVTTTDAQGHYEFGNLLLDEDYNGDGNGSEPIYSISAAAPAGYTPTAVGQGTGKNDSDQHSGAPAQPVQGETEAGARSNPNSEPDAAQYDFGFYVSGAIATASVGDFVWHDLNNDGIQDANEPGIEGVNLVLFLDADSDGQYDAGEEVGVAAGTNGPSGGFAITGPDGSYMFTNVPPGTGYQIQVLDAGVNGAGGSAGSGGDGLPGTALEGYADTPNHADQQAVDPPSMNNTNATVPFDLSAGEVNLAADFGYLNQTLYKITDRVWLDPDRSGGNYSGGGYGAGDSPLIGATVTLLKDPDGIPGNGDEVPIATTTTADGSTDVDGDGTDEAAGEFVFFGLEGNTNYVVALDPLSGPLAGLEGTDYPAEIFSLPVSLGAADVAGENFPYFSDGMIGDTIWLDNGDGGGTPDNGTQDGSESGIGGVTVTLYRDGSVVARTTTDGNGKYRFTGLDSGDYRIVVDTSTLPGGATGWNVTGDPDATGVNPCVGCDNESSVTLTVGGGGLVTSNLDQDFGFNKATATNASVSGTVWNDLDKDGPTTDYQPEAGEQGIGGVTVNLIGDAGPDGIVGTPDDIIQAIATTAADGTYRFDNVPAGEYYVDVVETGVPAEYPEHTTLNDPSTLAPQPPTTRRITVTAGGTVTGDPGSPDTGRVNFGYGGATTTPVTLAYFQAKEIAGGYSVEWRTVTEVGNVGFHLFADMFDGRERVQLNPTLIETASDGDSFEPQTYTQAVDEEGIDRFWLVDVDIFGRQIWHGPYVPDTTYGGIPDSKIIDWAPIAREHERKKAKIKLARVKQSNDSVKLIVGEDGLYRVSYDALAEFGLRFRNIRLDRLFLTNQGEPVPVRVVGSPRRPNRFGDGGYVEFYGKARDSLYGADNVYVLQRRRTKDAPALFVLEDPRQAAPEGPFVEWYMDTVTEAAQLGYSLSSPAREPWYMKMLKNGQSATYQLTLDAYAGDVASATVHLEVWGDTDWPRAPDHHLVVELNGVEVTDEWFDGRVIHRVDAVLGEALREDTDVNALTVTTPGIPGIAPRINIDSVGMTYPRRFVARDDALSFTAAGAAFEVSGLSSDDVTVYRADGYHMEILTGAETEAQDDGSYSVRFPGAPKVAAYHVVGASRVRVPDLEPLSMARNLTRGRADAVVISHPDFINDDLAFLVGLREWQGYKIKVIDVNTIYAAYGDHLVHPEAIRSYIREAADRLGASTFILVGGDNRDYHGYGSPDAVSFIPSLYARTSEFATFAPCDPCLGDLDGDNVQDVAISRLPVRTGEELAILVDKTIDYEFKLYGKSMVLAVDRYDAGNGYDFAVDGESILAEVPAQWLVVDAFLDDWDDAPTMREEAIIPAVNAGMAVTAFVGHSGPTTWTFDPLFNAGHAAALNNPTRPTVVAQWGCWNTYYVLPSFETLGMNFLLKGDRGAAAVLGATTLTEAVNEAALARLLFSEVGRVLEPGVTLGEAVLRAKRELAKTHPDALDVLLGWTILGDALISVEP